MKSLWRIAYLIASLVAVVTLLCCGGGSSQSVQPLKITTATLPNGTAGSLYSQAVQVTGGVAPYTWSPSAGTLPHNLQLGSSNTNTDTISGTPDTPIQADAFTVKVTDASGQSATQPYTVSILALPDTLTLSPANLNFNPQLSGTASATLATTLSNSGTSSVAILNIAPSGTNAGDFSQSNTCASSLAAGTNCGISVIFTPSQAGPRVASMIITDDTAGSPHQLGLNGAGLTSGANATPSASSLTFSSQDVGTTSPAQTLTLTNYGTATLNVTNITATGDFAETNNCGTSLASAASCPINVSFTPSTTGTLSGTLSLIDNALDSPQSITLSGTGACVPPGGRCHARGSCCPDPSGPDICGAQGICILE
jgi:hypothetical protein